jgi:tight adherence protein B
VIGQTGSAVEIEISPSAMAPIGGSGGAVYALLVGGAVAIFVSISSLVMLAWPGNRTTAGQSLGQRAQRTTDAARPSVTERLIALADRALTHNDRRTGLANSLDVAAIPLRPGEFLVIAMAAGIIATVLFGSLWGPIGVILGVVLVPVVARVVITTRIDRRRKAFNEQLPDVLQLLISALRAGYALPQALDAVAHQAAEPARTEFERVMFETRVGRDITESLAATARRMKSRDFDWVVSSFDINREIGGELGKVLDSVARTVRERQELTRQIRTLTAEGRMSAYVLTGMPIVLVGAFSLISPGYFDPLLTGIGPIIIGAALVLLATGWVWARRLIKAQL